MKKKKFSVSVTFSFAGTFDVSATSREQAREFIEKHVGLVLGRDIHHTLPEEDIDWNFNLHPDKQITHIS